MSSQPFVGEIIMFGGNFAPLGWAFCNGQLMAIAGNEALFQLLGTTYGGDGQNTFALPNLQGRIPLHQGSGFVIGQLAGSETVTLNQNQIPTHTHQARAQSGNGNSPALAGTVWATPNFNEYVAGPPNSTMSPATIGPAGGSQPHDNMMPFLAVNFIIAIDGIFPSQN